MNEHDRPYLDLWRITKEFPTPKGSTVVVRDFSLRVRQGEFVTLIGHSGCGKSTVLSMVAGLTPLTAGGMILDEREVDGPGPDRGVVFQAPCLLPWQTALQNVQLGVDKVFPGKTRLARSEIAAHYLQLVGLGNAMQKRHGELSQGMRQRVGIARAFAINPKMLLLDEPFGMLDSLTRCELQEILINVWSQDQKTALMVTHDVDEALFLSDRIVMMTNGPNARVGDILDVPFARPRIRSEVMEHPDYYKLREHLITFLEDQDHARKNDPPAAPTLDEAQTDIRPTLAVSTDEDFVNQRLPVEGLVTVSALVPAVNS